MTGDKWSHLHGDQPLSISGPYFRLEASWLDPASGYLNIYLKAITHRLTDYEILEITERITMRVGTLRP